MNKVGPSEKEGEWVKIEKFYIWEERCGNSLSLTDL